MPRCYVHHFNAKKLREMSRSHRFPPMGYGVQNALSLVRPPLGGNVEKLPCVKNAQKVQDGFGGGWSPGRPLVLEGPLKRGVLPVGGGRMEFVL
jgi:hypothetical protein